MATIAEQLSSMSVTDNLKHATMPETWVKWPWSFNRGFDSESGWSPESWTETVPHGSRSGWYWSPAKVKGGHGATILRRNGSFGHINLRQFSVWLFSEGGEKASGYQLVAWQTGAADSYTFKLRKWVAGVESLLGETASVAMTGTGSFAVAALSGKVSAWVRQSEASSWTLVGSEVSDAAFSEGYSGVDGNGSNPLLIDFATAALTPASSGARSGSRFLLGVGR
jgi:hypothetical protein